MIPSPEIEGRLRECELCLRKFEGNGSGRPRKYCSRHCGIRANYRRRKGLTLSEPGYVPYRNSKEQGQATLRDICYRINRARHAAQQSGRWNEAQALELAEESVNEAIRYRKESA